MAPFLKFFVSALLLVFFAMQGIFLPLLQAVSGNEMGKEAPVASVFDITKHDAKNSQDKGRFYNVGNQSEIQSDEENAFWEFDCCISSYRALTLQSFFEFSTVEAAPGPMSFLSDIFRPPRA